ncbi:MAG TPA: outer membrane protein assembly factor BamD [Flavobacteriales bacterium]|nr:outer membrane protein assembly factor BamD [Flavobacteriales bacterium]
MTKKITTIILLASVLFSCGQYQKVLKSDDYNYKYIKAVAYYESEDFNRAMPLFNELATVLRGTAKMEEVSYYFAYCHYSTGDNLMAAYLFKNFTQNYPNSKHTEECAYLSAYCYYLEAPNFSLDATNNYKAIKELQAFVNRFPASEKVEKCNELLDELRVILSKKAFENAKQYFVTENYKSAIIALENVLIDFPSYTNREEVHFLIVQSSYLLAINSISTKVVDRLKATLDAYEQFKDNYATSGYLKELEYTYKKTNQTLTELKQIKDEI